MWDKTFPLHHEKHIVLNHLADHPLLSRKRSWKKWTLELILKLSLRVFLNHQDSFLKEIKSNHNNISGWWDKRESCWNTNNPLHKKYQRSLERRLLLFLHKFETLSPFLQDQFLTAVSAYWKTDKEYENAAHLIYS